MPVYREKNKKKWTKDGRSYYFKCYYLDIYGKRKQYVSKLLFFPELSAFPFGLKQHPLR